jgi:methyl-accepting chemotaxis protein
MKNWTVGRRITLGFAGVIIIALALGAFAYTRLIVINDHSNQIAQKTLPTIELVYRAQKNAKDYDRLVYKHIGSSSAADMTQLETLLGADTKDNNEVYADLDKFLTDEKGRALLDTVKTARAGYVQIRNAVLDVSRQGTNNVQAYSLARTQMDPASDRYLASLESLIDFVRTDAQDTSKSIQSAVQTSKAGILTGLSLALVVGIGISWMISRKISHILRTVSESLNDGSNQVASAAAQVSTSSQKLAEGSGQQAASIEETSSSLEEMSSMIKRNADNTTKANELAKLARTAADQGATDVQTMNAAMMAIKGASDDIAKIIKTIDEIAFQTNILALNAAVEAARAGEAGMGFAVVAEEVRNLAQRSAQAAKETAAKIEGSINKTAQGVSVSQQVADALNRIVTQIRQVDDLVAEVAGASREQTQGITQINTAVSEMDKVTQGNAASAEESAAAAEELSAQAAIMKESVTELLLLVGGNGQADTHKSKAPPAYAKPVLPAARIKGASSASTNGKMNGHGHNPVVPVMAPAKNRQAEIPMDGDFKDF